MSTRPPSELPDDPAEILGDPLWDSLGRVETAPLPDGFDQRFREQLRAGAPPWYRRYWMPISAGVGGMAAAAAALIVLTQPPAVVEPPLEPVVPAADDLALVAELELVESLELLEDLDLLLAWDGNAP